MLSSGIGASLSTSRLTRCGWAAAYAYATMVPRSCPTSRRSPARPSSVEQPVQVGGDGLLVVPAVRGVAAAEAAQVGRDHVEGSPANSGSRCRHMCQHCG